MLANVHVFKDKLYDVEIFMWDDGLYQEKKTYRNATRSAENRFDWREGYEFAYIKVFEASPYQTRRIIMPKNMFEVVEIKNNLEQIVIIEEDIANVSTSLITVNYTTGQVFRANHRIMFNATLRDQFGNLRNNSYFKDADNITVDVWIHNNGADSLKSTHNFTHQDVAHGHGYYLVYTPDIVSSNYFLKFKINGLDYTRHQEAPNNSSHMFNFTVINANVDVTTSPITYLGYHYFPANETLDCIFVNQDLFVIIDMKDLYGNAVLISDKNSWFEQFTIYFEGGSSFAQFHCVPYTGVEGSFWYKDFNMTLYNTHT